MTAAAILLCFSVLVIVNVANARFDIQEQCLNEYGLDLDGVLRQFRRSDDYLHILLKKTEKFTVLFNDISALTTTSALERMKKKIQQEFGIQDERFMITTTKATTTEPKIRRLKYIKSRRQYKDASDGDAVEKLGKVQIIDQYSRINGPLTIEERNYYKNVAFTFAGDVIHSLIRAFDGDPLDKPAHSTRGVDANPAPSTTEHMLQHVATNEINSTVSGTERTQQRQRLRSNTKFSLVSVPYPIFGGK